MEEPTGVPEMFRSHPGHEKKPGGEYLVEIGGRVFKFKGEPGTPVKSLTDDEYCGGPPVPPILS